MREICLFPSPFSSSGFSSLCSESMEDENGWMKGEKYPVMFIEMIDSTFSWSFDVISKSYFIQREFLSEFTEQPEMSRATKGGERFKQII